MCLNADLKKQKIEMNLKNIIVATSLLLSTSLAFAQETPKENEVVAAAKTEKKETLFNIKFFGFIRHEAAFDSRQTVDAREGNLLFWGKDVNYDKNGTDTNSASKFQMLSIVSRAGVKITTPDVLNAKVSGVLEGDFFGTTDSNAFRLRHAYITLDWKNTQLGFGQFWNPLTNVDMLPGVINFSGGAPYMPFNRNPQIRLTQKLSDKFNLIVAAVSQRDLTSNTSPYINNSFPAGHVQVNYKTKSVLLGVAGHFEQIRPTLSVGTGANLLASNQRLSSATFMAYGRFDTKALLIRAEATLAQNGASFAMLGGYVGYTPITSGVDQYSTMNTQSYWIDLAGKTKKIIPGFFAGFSQNDGVHDFFPGVAKAYGLANAIGGIAASGNTIPRTINYIYRLAPRIEVPLKNLKFDLEAEYSMAQWGTADNTGRAFANESLVGNWRILFATTLKF
jgi:hypothetical protein